MNISYNLIIGYNIANTLDSVIQKNTHIEKILIITDSIVENLYLKKIKSILSKNRIYEIVSYIIDAGEESKNWNNYNNITEILFNSSFTKNDLIISLGGGVVGDLSGFAASTYKRGINWINIPTTLLSMVDASIGGKTAINNIYGKNMIGTIFNPLTVLIDIYFLNSLNVSRIIEGIVELTKHFILLNKTYFNQFINILDNLDNIKNIIQIKDFLNLLVKSIMIKKSIIEKDPYDKGLRKILNFGHTIGHALEKANNKYSHGESIARGIIAECSIGEYLGITKKNTANKIKYLYEKLNLDYKLEKPQDIKKIIKLCMNDKKKLDNTSNIPMILIKDIGKIAYKNNYSYMLSHNYIQYGIEKLYGNRDK